MYKGASVYDSGGKLFGKVSASVNHGYLLVKKKGVLTNEEFRVPISCISHFKLLYSIRKIEEALMRGIRSGIDRIYLIADNEDMARSE